MSQHRAALAERIAALKWYHRMELDGHVTPGVSHTDRGLPRLCLPESFQGMSVLDVGAWDGFYSFEAARRGATRVLATDSFAWDGSCWGSKDGFDLARSVLGMEDVVEDQLIDVMDLDPEELGGRFDVTLLLGVLYHLKDPISALEKAASVTSELLVIETETALNWLPWSAARIYPSSELNDDDTNFYAFNRNALEGLLKRVGFSRVEVVYRTSLVRRLGRAVVAAASGTSLISGFRSSRIVIHARY